MLKLDLEITKKYTIINLHGTCTLKDTNLLDELREILVKHSLNKLIYNFQDVKYIDSPSLKQFQNIINLISFKEGIQCVITNQQVVKQSLNLPTFLNRQEAIKALLR